MSKTKAGKTTKGSRDARPKYLGLKCSGGEMVKPGTIVIRQRGSRYHVGSGVGIGRDYTIYAKIEGKVTFYELQGKKYVSIAPAA
jgi:large subunit ribosomal protein L27